MDNDDSLRTAEVDAYIERLRRERDEAALAYITLDSFLKKMFSNFHLDEALYKNLKLPVVRRDGQE